MKTELKKTIQEAIRQAEATKLPPALHLRWRAPSQADILLRVCESLKNQLHQDEELEAYRVKKDGPTELEDAEKEDRAKRLCRFLHYFFLINAVTPLRCKKPTKKQVENTPTYSEIGKLTKENLLGTNGMDEAGCTTNLEKIFGSLDAETENTRALAEADPKEEFLPGIKKQLKHQETLVEATLHRLAEVAAAQNKKYEKVSQAQLDEEIYPMPTKQLNHEKNWKSGSNRPKPSP